MHEISLTSERKTQLIDITDRVRDAVGDATGSAVLVYVPHTTAAVTINEKIDPALVADLERAFEKVVGDDWGWVHDDVDGPNGPSHGRASVAGRAGADPAARRRACARALPGGLPLRVRRAEASLGLRHGPAIDVAPLFGLRLRTARLELRLPTPGRVRRARAGRRGRGCIRRSRCRSGSPGRTAPGSPGSSRASSTTTSDRCVDWTPGALVARPLGVGGRRADRVPGDARRGVRGGAARRDRIVARTAVPGAGLRDGDAGRRARSGLPRPGARLAAESGYAEDNLQSKGVSAKLGYEPAGEGWESPRGVPVRHLKLGRDRCALERDRASGRRGSTGSTRACRSSARADSHPRFDPRNRSTPNRRARALTPARGGVASLRPQHQV